MNYRKKGQAPQHEAFRAKFQLVDTSLEQGTFSGYASVFGSEVDTWPRTIVDKGAFTKTLTEGIGRVKVLWQHDPWCPIGKPTEMREDDKGLYIVGKISDTQAGKDALTLVRDGVVEEMSIGFDPIRWEMVPDPNCTPAMQSTMDGQVRHIKELRLWEVSLVTFAADPMAQVYAVHALQTAKAPAWKSDEALTRVRQWCGFESPTDDGNEKAVQRYAHAMIGGHLVADVEDGQLKVVPLAVVMAGIEMVKASAAHMAGDEARQLLETAYEGIGQILAAANGSGDATTDDTSGTSETQSVARAEQLARVSKASTELRMMELALLARSVDLR